MCILEEKFPNFHQTLRRAYLCLPLLISFIYDDDDDDLVELGIEFRALHLQSKHSTTWAKLPVLLVFVCFSDRVLCFCLGLVLPAPILLSPE
jgi:hypothetical protein